jgi:hypothetical protein
MLSVSNRDAFNEAIQFLITHVLEKWIGGALDFIK